jgi:tetratricopeptide (TPR) repeat protein
LILVFGLSLWAQADKQETNPAGKLSDRPANKPAEPATDGKEPVYAEPAEEDESLATPKVYTFNPLQAKKEIETGDFYMKRGNYRGAAARFREASMWDDGSEDAFYKWGEAAEKMKDYTSAREALGKFASMTADKKKADEVRKRMAKFPKEDHVTAPQPPFRMPPGAPVPGQNPARQPGGVGQPGAVGQYPGQYPQYPGTQRR